MHQEIFCTKIKKQLRLQNELFFFTKTKDKLLITHLWVLYLPVNKTPNQPPSKTQNKPQNNIPVNHLKTTKHTLKKRSGWITDLKIYSILPWECSLHEGQKSFQEGLKYFNVYPLIFFSIRGKLCILSSTFPKHIKPKQWW